jgi:hypothetical protein
MTNIDNRVLYYRLDKAVLELIMHTTCQVQKMLYRVTVKYIPLSGISSGDSLNLLENRVDFKLYAAEQHLNELKNIRLKHGTIMGTPEIRIKTEMEIDCFLASVMGALDSLFVQINRDLGRLTILVWSQLMQV